MAIYDGMVTIADNDIPVIVELDDDHLRMSAAGTEIGHWPIDECEISHVGDSVYTITAENETLRFVPNQPSLFATEVNDAAEPPAVAMAPAPGTEQVDGSKEAPPAKPVTMGLFYALCLITVALAVWALISIIF
ncbi:MAG TPA: hypothetical protein VK969_01120 [Acidimicrobiia bacterium]|nr:hypothetical protein [Acidimicrobiia bacterium]